MIDLKDSDFSFGPNCSKHPEILPGESFYSNMTLDRFKKLDIKSKRAGVNAYENNYRPLIDHVPVFIKNGD